MENDSFNHRLELSVVIPCFNEQDVLPELYARVSAACSDCAEDWELVLVDDGSTDRTWQMLEQVSEQDPRVTAVRLSRNFGQHAALLAGLRISRGKEVLILDADLQDPPELLPRMRKILKEQEADVVYGQRRSRAGESLFKRVTAWLFYRIIGRLSEVPIPPDTGLFRLMRREVVDAVLQFPQSTRFLRGVFAWVGYRQAAMPYDREDRAAGTSKWPTRKMASLAVDALTTFSMAHLLFAAFASAGFLLLGLTFLILVFVQWTGERVIAGVWVLSTLFCFAAFAHFLSTGVIALYFGKVSAQTSRRPLYFVAEIAHSSRTCSSMACEGIDHEYEDSLATAQRVYPR